jgi:hypothetical protein
VLVDVEMTYWLSGTLYFPRSFLCSKITFIKARASDNVKPVACPNSPSFSSVPASSSPRVCSFSRAVRGRADMTGSWTDVASGGWRKESRVCECVKVEVG